MFNLIDGNNGKGTKTSRRVNNFHMDSISDGKYILAAAKRSAGNWLKAQLDDRRYVASKPNRLATMNGRFACKHHLILAEQQMQKMVNKVK